jgi:hypothetical protein
LFTEFEDAAGLGPDVGLAGRRSARLADHDQIRGPFPGGIEDGRRDLPDQQRCLDRNARSPGER